MTLPSTPSLRGKSPSCADLLKALADDTRLKIVRLLMGGPRHVYELNQELQVEQSLLSHHLRALREAGIVAATRDGKAVLYSLAPDLAARRRGRDRLDLGCCKLSFD